MSTHTPGPWETKGPRRADRGDDYAIIAEGEIIAEAFGQTSATNFPPSEANARLIAAAPDMLAALKLLDNAWKYSTEVCQLARAAIAKAEGQS